MQLSPRPHSPLSDDPMAGQREGRLWGPGLWDPFPVLVPMPEQLLI